MPFSVMGNTESSGELEPEPELVAPECFRIETGTRVRLVGEKLYLSHGLLARLLSSANANANTSGRTVIGDHIVP